MGQQGKRDGNFRGRRREKRDVFIPIEIGAYDRDTAHFTTRQDGAYFRLMKAGWVEGGRLARTEEQLRIITGETEAEWAEDRPVLAEKYRIDSDGAWVHEGMQARLLIIGEWIDPGLGDGPSRAERGANLPGAVQGGGRPAATDPALSAKRSEAARRRWERGNGDAKPGGDAKPDANLHADDANPDANGDANLHPVLHPNLNLKESSNHQTSSLPAAREAPKSNQASRPALGEGGGLVDRLLRIFNNPAWLNASQFAEVIREWRGLGLSDDAICTEVASVLDAKRMQTPGWMPGHPGYCTPALKRLAALEAEATRLPPDPWAQRVASYAQTKFWMDEWEGKPDSDRPNPAIPRALLAKYGFKKEAA